jgi:hypothetical protein
MQNTNRKFYAYQAPVYIFKKRRRNGNDVNKKNKLIEGKTYQCNLDYQYNEFFLNQDLLFHIIIVLL